MANERREIWFPAKRYGWGWGLPVAWQGWLVLLAYVLLAIGGSALLVDYRHNAAYTVYMLLLSAALAFVCWLKGEKPRWRWRA